LRWLAKAENPEKEEEKKKHFRNIYARQTTEGKRTVSSSNQ